MKERIILKVKTTSGGYAVVIGWGILRQLKEQFEGLEIRGKVGIVTNPRIGRLYKETLRRGLRSAGLEPYLFLIPDGERYKTLRSVERIYTGLIDAQFERGSTLLALGGGVIGDITGFVAATYLRGIALVQIPTSLVAQVDSSIGGKTGVDHRQGKNLIGAFYPPRLVYTDLAVLKTLSRREFIGGMAEVVKYGVIADANLFCYLEKYYEEIMSFQPDSIFEIVKRSCRIKAEVVSQDERESGRRRILNYGHTLGHALETLTGYTRFKHGEAIAIGMDYAARLSYHLGLCPLDLIQRQQRLLEALGLPTQLPWVYLKRLVGIMAVDKKVRQGRIHFVLPIRIGHVVVEPVEERHIIKVLRQTIQRMD